MKHVQVQACHVNTLFEPDYILSLIDNGKALLCMNEFTRTISVGTPLKPIGMPSIIPPPPPRVTEFAINVLDVVPDLTYISERFDYDLEDNKNPNVGGEKEAFKRLEEVLQIVQGRILWRNSTLTI